MQRQVQHARARVRATRGCLVKARRRYRRRRRSIANRRRAAGGLGETRIPLPADTWVDALTGAEHHVHDEGGGSGSLLAADVFADRPVALLVRAHDLREGGR